MTDREWLALVACTETKRPHEMPYVQAVVINRMRAGKTWPGTIVRVVRQAKQFSAFNPIMQLSDEQAFNWIRKELSDELFKSAEACAEDMLSRPAHLWPVDPATFWFWSPQSMVPRGSVPYWAREDHYSFTVSGVDPWRFVFAMAVPSNHYRRGNGVLFDMTERRTA